MGLQKYLTKAWLKREGADLEGYVRQEAIRWRREPAVVRIDRPTRLEKARRLGYKAKQGIVVARVRVRRGGARKPRPSSGRRPKAAGAERYTRAISLKRMAINKALKKFPNLKALNAYYVWSDGKHKWFEVIMADPHHPSVRSDPRFKWLAESHQA